MNKCKLGIFFSLLLLVGMTSCNKREITSKLVINEVMTDNQNGYQDDYGIHSAWIEIFNRSYTTTDLAAYLIKVSHQAGDTTTYFIPKGDVLTAIKPRQHALFWADGEPRKGTFHTNFKLEGSNRYWIGLYNSGKMLIDEVEIGENKLEANQSFGRISDAALDWEIKDGGADRYVTPSTNNKTLDSNAKMEKFAEHDSVGVGMAISAMSVVFFGLLALYISFRIIGKISVRFTKRNEMKVQGITDEQEANNKNLGEVPGEVYAAIGMAMYEMQNDVHDVEDTILTIAKIKRSYSPWSSKIHTLRQNPRR